MVKTTPAIIRHACGGQMSLFQEDAGQTSRKLLIFFILIPKYSCSIANGANNDSSQNRIHTTILVAISDQQDLIAAGYPRPVWLIAY